MRIVFADTLYWIALINSRDQWHQRAVSINTFCCEISAMNRVAFLREVLPPFEQSSGAR